MTNLVAEAHVAIALYTSYVYLNNLYDIISFAGKINKTARYAINLVKPQKKQKNKESIKHNWINIQNTMDTVEPIIITTFEEQLDETTSCPDIQD